MNEIKKPEIISERRRHLLNGVYKHLKERVYTKAELCEEFRVDERIIRDIINEIGKRFAVITPGKGYKIAGDSAEDTLEEIHKIRDFDSRAAEFQERKTPLWSDIEERMKERNITTLAELERELERRKGGE